MIPFTVVYHRKTTKFSTVSPLMKIFRQLYTAQIEAMGCIMKFIVYLRGII